MKKLILLLLFIPLVSFGQDKKSTNKIITDSFVENYNSEDYKAIFLMFSDEMKDALPINKTSEFFTTLNLQVGNIVNREFVKYENASYASYKTTFERAVLKLNISIDNNQKINGLFVKPFVDEVLSKNAINNLSIKEILISKNQTKLIFEKSKFFPNQTQISIAFIKNGDISYYGIKRQNDTISIFDNYKSIFEIGSITKVFTSNLLANFIVNKKIKLNDNINDYLNIPFRNNTLISFKSLSNHTSGLPRLPTNLDLEKENPKNPYKEYEKADLENYLTESIELTENLIGKYLYSNLGAGLIGYTLSEIENLSYERLFNTLIFSKYNMLNSTFNHNELNEVLVRGLDAQGNEVPNWELSVLASAGGILSNVEDLAKYGIAQFDTSNKELELTRQKTFKLNENMDIGLGWHIIKSKSNNQWYWHNGGTGGYSSSMSIDVKNKNGIIILSNVSAFNPSMENIDKLCFELMETLTKNNSKL